jgi:hypothetical protein
MPASAPARSTLYSSSEDDSDESEFPPTGPLAGSTSMQAQDRERLIKLEKVCTEELTVHCLIQMLY